MKKKHKIIVSITGIVIVLLGLISLTYAYYLTNIVGNTNTNSISITSAGLSLTYSDGNGAITASNIKPGNTIDSKTFTVTNTGNNDVDNYGVILENVINTFTNTEDLDLTLTCVSKNASTGVVSGTCSGFTGDYPTVNTVLVNQSIASGIRHEYTLTLVYNETNTNQSADMGKTISGKIQIYDMRDVVTLTGTITGYNAGDYVELQSDPMTSQIDSSGNYIIEGVIPGSHTLYVKNSSGTSRGTKSITITKGTTASINSDGSSIVVTDESAKVTLNVTSVSSTLTTVGVNVKSNITLLSEKIIEKSVTSTSISTAEDDDGTSYYYKGIVSDNYLNFAGMCWRIVRVKGDGSVKLILASELSCSSSNLSDTSGYATDGAAGSVGNLLEAHYGYKSHATYSELLLPDYINSTTDNSNSARTKLNTWLTTKVTSTTDKALLKNDTWCLGDQSTVYIWAALARVYSSFDNYFANVEGFLSDELYYTNGIKLDTISGRDDFDYTYKCLTNDLKDTNKIGLLTFDEVFYAIGVEISEYNQGNIFYLSDNALNYYSTLLSVYRTDAIIYVNNTGSQGVSWNITSAIGSSSYHNFSWEYVTTKNKLRPVITLIADTKYVSGDGTISNPYVVS